MCCSDPFREKAKHRCVFSSAPFHSHSWSAHWWGPVLGPALGYCLLRGGLWRGQDLGRAAQLLERGGTNFFAAHSVGACWSPRWCFLVRPMVRRAWVLCRPHAASAWVYSARSRTGWERDGRFRRWSTGGGTAWRVYGARATTVRFLVFLPPCSSSESPWQRSPVTGPSVPRMQWARSTSGLRR
jgi:hypothetical protein